MRQATATRESAEDKISSLNQKLSNVSVSIYSDIFLQVPFSTNNQLFIYLGGIVLGEPHLRLIGGNLCYVQFNLIFGEK